MIGEAIARVASGIGLLALAALLVLAGAGFAVAAAHLFLLEHFSAPLATVFVAAVLFVLAAVIALVARARVAHPLPRRPRTRAAMGAGDARPAAMSTSEAFAAGLSADLPGTPMQRAGMALVAGLVLGASPEVRRMVGDIASQAMRPPPPRPPYY